MRRYIYIILGLFLLLPLKINAANLSLKVACPSEAYAGSTVSCTISANTDGEINGVSGNYQLSEGLKYSSFAISKTTSFNVSQTTEKGFVLGNTSGFAKTIVLGKLNVIIPKNASLNTVYTVSVNNISASDMNYNDISVSTAKDTIKVVARKESDIKKSNNANLKKIIINGEALVVSSDKTDYALNVKNNIQKITISYELEDLKSIVKIEGDLNLKLGENSFKLVVTAEDGTKKTYNISVNRANAMSNNNYLSSLKINDYLIDFDKKNLSYNVNINNTDKLDIIAQPEDENSKVYIIGNEKLKNNSVIHILVIAEDQSLRDYTIVVRQENNVIISLILGSCIFLILIIAMITFVKKAKKS